MVIGVNLNSPSWNYHAVALDRGRFVSAAVSSNPNDIVQWCACSSATVVALGGPSQFRVRGGPMRTADREMRAARLIACSTPVELKRAPWPGFPNWMTDSHRLYRLFAPMFPLYRGGALPGRCTIETREEAAEHALCCEPPKDRPTFGRLEIVLRRARFDPGFLLDHAQAALFALVAQALVDGQGKVYGDEGTGLVVVPAKPLPLLPEGDSLPASTLRVVDGYCAICRGTGWRTDEQPCSCNPERVPSPRGERDSSRN